MFHSIRTTVDLGMISTNAPRRTGSANMAGGVYAGRLFSKLAQGTHTRSVNDFPIK